jgi:hypothetical protein
MEKNVSKEQMNKLPYIIAVDFDGTLVEDRFPEIGEPIEATWGMVREAIDKGAKIILWTSRDNERLKAAVEFCTERGLHFDAINDNLDECKILFNNSTRKVYANEYWDDKAIAGFCRTESILVKNDDDDEIW